MEKHISVDELKAGMKLSKPVYVEGTHIILINRDVVLDSSNIGMLQQLGISNVFIHENGRPSAGRANCAAEPPEKKSEQPAACGKILVVDDEPEICHYIKDVLENSGYTVLTANSAREAWDVISGDDQIDTVFLDLMMPEVGGLELLKRIRSEIKRNINAVIVTAKKSMQDLIMAKELGISGYLTKPFDPGKLVIIANQASNEKKTM
ncbi:MAG TPA: response regulator transcription factor [Candidatus Wallbacteria bacterium]|nr:response regulator transcription factor [Candidatus Wallbacteria bacterium]